MFISPDPIDGTTSGKDISALNLSEDTIVLYLGKDLTLFLSKSENDVENLIDILMWVSRLVWEEGDVANYPQA